MDAAGECYCVGPLTLWATFSVASMSGESYEVVLSYFASPFNVAMFCLFLLAGFYHASLGLQVFIEDYVHREGLKLGILIGTKFALALTGIMSIFAVLRTAFGS